jgi:hypothetical protein
VEAHGWSRCEIERRDDEAGTLRLVNGKREVGPG